MFNAYQERQPPADNNIISAKLKLNELFLTWLSKQDTVQYIGDLLHGLNPSTTNSTTNSSSTSSNNLEALFNQVASSTSNNNNNELIHNNGDNGGDGGGDEGNGKEDDIEMIYAKNEDPEVASIIVLDNHINHQDQQDVVMIGTNQQQLESPNKINKRSQQNDQSKGSQVEQPERKVYKREPSVIIKIPTFYTPKVPSIASLNDKTESDMLKIKNRFQSNKIDSIKSFDEFESIIKELHILPRILVRLLFKQISSTNLTNQFITLDQFSRFWKDSIIGKDTEEILFNVLKKSKSSTYLVYDDFIIFARTLLEIHPGLDFLKNTPEFQERYTETVIVRIFYINSKQKGRITTQDLKNNNFIKSLYLLDGEPDINKHLEYFSYEHFYVIYCKFWELDTDHDLYIGSNDLARYSNFSLTDRVVQRIIDCPVFLEDTRFSVGGKKLSYRNFVWFILSEEDKTNDTSIEYWFKCLDFDHDGILSFHEMEYFYNDQKDRLDSLNLEPPVFTDLLCQILDMIKPINSERITLIDLKQSKLAGYLYNILFNTTKFFIQETKESIAFSDQSMSDWNRFAKAEYEKALAEEGSQNRAQVDDYDDDEDDDMGRGGNGYFVAYDDDEDSDEEVDDEINEEDEDDDDDDETLTHQQHQQYSNWSKTT